VIEKSDALWRQVAPQVAALANHVTPGSLQQENPA
jgi:hypothetical protein